ncbi:hypothetical protein ACLKA7_001807 [Drosophila subpalustris]
MCPNDYPKAAKVVQCLPLVRGIHSDCCEPFCILEAGFGKWFVGRGGVVLLDYLNLFVLNEFGFEQFDRFRPKGPNCKRLQKDTRLRVLDPINRHPPTSVVSVKGLWRPNPCSSLLRSDERNLQPRTPGGENDNEDSVFGRRKALTRTPPPSAPPASNGTSVVSFGADGNDVQKSNSDPLEMLKCLGLRARELVKRMNDKRHIDIPMKELAMRVVALQALVLKNLEKQQCSSTVVATTGTQTSPGPANSGAKRLRESPQVSHRNSPKKQRGSRQNQSTKQLYISDQINDESTPSVTVDRSATPAAKKQLQWQQVGPKVKKKVKKSPT